jgi:hypothetical protein
MNGRQSGYGQYYDDPMANERVLPWFGWAVEQDPDRTQVDAYVSALLANHQPPCSEDLLVLQLSISDDEIEPEVVRVAARPAVA